jgi:hypothetical protein
LSDCKVFIRHATYFVLDFHVCFKKLLPMLDLFYLKPKEFKLPVLQWPTLLILSFVMLVGQAQTPASGITEPAGGDTVSGVVVVRGTAVHPDYLRYELAFLQESNPEAGWIVFAEGNQEVVNGTLAVWDTTVGRDIGAPIFPDGRYQLRLRVVKRDYNYDEYFVTNLTVAGDQPTPTATQPAATAAAGQVEATSIAPEGTSSFQQPTPLPSLTPFPTPTPPATPPAVVSAGPEEEGGSGGVLGALAAVETSRFSRAFWRGAMLTGVIFAAMALYLLLRAAGRRLWRYTWTRLRHDQAEEANVSVQRPLAHTTLDESSHEAHEEHEAFPS